MPKATSCSQLQCWWPSCRCRCAGLLLPVPGVGRVATDDSCGRRWRALTSRRGWHPADQGTRTDYIYEEWVDTECKLPAGRRNSALPTGSALLRCPAFIALIVNTVVIATSQTATWSTPNSTRTPLGELNQNYCYREPAECSQIKPEPRLSTQTEYRTRVSSSWNPWTVRGSWRVGAEAWTHIQSINQSVYNAP